MPVFNDIYVSDGNNLTELKDDINDIIQKEFLNPSGLYVDASFLKAVQKDGEIQIEYNMYRPDDLYGLNTPLENMLGIQVLRDPDDLVRMYYRDVLFSNDSFDVVTESAWLAQTKQFDDIMDGLDDTYGLVGIYNDLTSDAIDRYHEEGRIMYWELDEKFKDSNTITPSELKTRILKTEEAVRWKISEYLKDNPEATASYHGPYSADDEKMFEGIDHKHWQEKYKDHCSYATLLETKDNVKTTLNFKP